MFNTPWLVAYAGIIAGCGYPSLASLLYVKQFRFLLVACMLLHADIQSVKKHIIFDCLISGLISDFRNIPANHEPTTSYYSY